MDAFLAKDELARIDGLRPLAAELGVSMAQLALAWCLRQPGVSSVIVGVTRAEQLRDDAAASGLALPPEIAKAIDAMFPG
jgi:aryl-alcohol dehydrogenase-like predicted oxidoreductase